MEIKTDYYFRNKEGILRPGGKIVFNRYRIILAEGKDIPEKGIPFYSSSTSDSLKVQNEDGSIKSVEINRIITEKEYTANQTEFYVRLNWMNQQKFKWINKKHTFQKKKFLLHLALTLLLIYFVYEILQLLTD